MKTMIKVNSLVSILVLIMISSSSLAQNEKEKAAPKGKIIEAIVYANSAQVTRKLNANCSAGFVEFGKIPSNIHTKTLRAISSKGNVLGVTYRREMTGPADQAKKLLDEIKKLELEITDVNEKRNQSNAILTKLSSFKSYMKRVWSIEARSKTINLNRWNQALSLFKKEELNALKVQQESLIQTRKLRRKQQELYRQLAKVRQKQSKVTYRAKVILKCQGRTDVKLSYVIPNAGWKMAYQARMNTKTQSVEFVANATVYQATGEDWNDIKLSISTANLKRLNTPPSVNPIYIRTHQPKDRTKVLTRKFEKRTHLSTVAKPQDQQSSRKPAELAMKLRALEKISLKSDGSGVMVKLAKVKKRVDYGFESIPKLFPFVYHRIRIANPFDFPMLAGPISVFRNGRFIAKTFSKRIAPGQPIALSMGIDNQMQIKRWVKEEKRYKAGTFSSTQRLVHRYLIEVGNWTKKSRTISVIENIPVSQVKDIKIHLDKKATKPSEWNRKDGILTYRIKLQPRSKKQIMISYHVDLPDDYKVSGYATK